VLIKYGDEFVTLGFQDLIEVKSEGDTRLDVALRNPEHDITRAIKKVLYRYQGGGNLFGGIDSPVVFHGYVSSDDKLPQPLLELAHTLEMVLADVKEQGGDKPFRFQFCRSRCRGRPLAARLTKEYGMQPMVAGLLSTETFWFYMVVESEDQVVQVGLPAELDGGVAEGGDRGLA
jgi:ABC-2 type transport system permease protein